jgi:esterase
VTDQRNESVTGNVGRPSARTLRAEAFATRYTRLAAAAERHEIDPTGLVLPAEGMIVSAGRIGVHYLEWPGAVDDLALIFLHGGGLHAHTFDLVGNLLRDRARCVALDLRGHGESEWSPGRYGSEETADDISAMVTQLGLERVVVVGHSMGGIGGIAWAARHPPELAGLVIVDVGPELQNSATASINVFITSQPSFADLEEVDDFAAESAPAADGMAANLRWRDDGRLAFKYDDSQFYPDGIRLPIGDELRELARRITCPTKILRGSRSRVLSDAAASELADLIDGASWSRVEDAGHTIQSSNPRGLTAAIVDFVAEQGH